MKQIKTLIAWGADGFVSAMMENEMFAGGGETIEAAIDDLKKGVAFYLETAKEKGFNYPSWIAEPFGFEFEYDAVSMLKYAREYMKDKKIAELTGISSVQLGRYANDKATPRVTQQKKIVQGLQKFVKPFNILTT